jgi:hypothetical protein
VKGESPHEIGFIIGMVVGFIWVWWGTPLRGFSRSAGQANWIIMLICGGIGWLAGWALEWVFIR